MEIVIKMPKEFENHFNSDKFEDSLQRIRFDIHEAIIAKKDILSGNYEIEILDMLTEAFLNGTPLPKGHGRLIDEEQIPGDGGWDFSDRLTLTPTIIEADNESEEER